MKSTLKGVPVLPQGLDLQVGTRLAPARGGGRHTASAMPAHPRAHRSNAERAAPARRNALLAARRSCSSRALLLYPIGQTVYYSFTQLGRPDGDLGRHARRTRACSRARISAGAQEQRDLLLAIPVAIVLPLGVAFLLSGHIRGWQFFRSVFFLPTAVSWVVIGFVATRFFADEGILQGLLGDVGLGSLHPDMLSHEHRALFAVMITFVWSMFGTNLIVFLAGMATIDQSLYDAARVDGAGQFAVLSRITVPLLRRFIQFGFIVTLVTAFTALFSLIFVMTGGGPASARRRSSSTSTSGLLVG